MELWQWLIALAVSLNVASIIILFWTVPGTSSKNQTPQSKRASRLMHGCGIASNIVMFVALLLVIYKVILKTPIE